MTWEELKAKPIGTILHDVFEEGVRFIVMRGPFALCGYVGIPSEHPLAGHDYDNIPVEAHGGLTFGAEGDGLRPKGFYWYGWDYGHAGDYCFHDDTFPTELRIESDKKWLLEDVIEDSWDALYDFRKLVQLAEKISRR